MGYFFGFPCSDYPYLNRIWCENGCCFSTLLTLSGFESLIRKKKKSHRPQGLLNFFWSEWRDKCLLRKPFGCGDRCFATVPASTFVAKNNSPNCFLNAPHPLRVRVPHIRKERSPLTARVIGLLLVRVFIRDLLKI